MSDSPNQPAPQARPPTKNNDPVSNSIYSRGPSKSPHQNPPPPFEPLAKAAHLESQPMTTSSSSSSLPADQQMDTTGASPYGTRSRNRTGNPRPNYAEDRELDTDYEWNAGKKSQGTSSPAMPQNLPSGESDKPSAGNARRSSIAALNGTTMSNKATNPNVQNNNIPGMSSFHVHPDHSVAPAAPVLTRKRKAPGSGPAAPHMPPAATQAPASAISRRSCIPPQSSRLRQTNLMTFESCQCYLKAGKLKADDGTVLAVNDQVYLVCEPPGEPYYLARIMEFLHVDNDPNAPVDSLRVNWFLRPRDIPRKVNDTRFVYASMQSDTSPITSLRGKCRILHRSDIADLDAHRKEPNSFWYEKLFDRYIHRFYDVIPSRQVINLPAKVKKVLDERWKFIIMEIGKGRELTSATKSCKRCQGYCASGDSVDCAVCKNTYHMNCVRPPLLKKPARGFGWSCGPCSRKQEKKLEARNTPIVGEKGVDGEEGEVLDEEEEEHAAASNSGSGDSPNDVDGPSSGARPPTAEQVAQAKLWPFRYLGIHCRVEDALDYDDRIYPRATSRLGPKHQATVQIWPGRRVEYVKPADVKKKFMKGNSHKKEAKLTKDTIAALEADKIAREKRPKWVMDEPPGYVSRGEDHSNSDLRNTAQLKFRLPQVGEMSSRGAESSIDLTLDQRETLVDEYMSKAKLLAPLLGLQEYSTNFLDKALELLATNNFQSDKALQQLRHVNKRKDLKEPDFSKEEVKRFEEGVRRYGSELRFVKNHVKSQKYGDIVRFYYIWKKTPEGRKIWGAFEGRKGKKQQKQLDSKLVDDVADDVDDSAFDNAKAAARRRGFECRFCGIRSSPQWRRAPATAPGTTVPIDPSLKNSKDKSAHLMLAICQRCAYLWRCYAIQWENPDEVAKKVASNGGRAWKRRVDEELLAELTTASVASSIGISTTAAAAAAAIGVDVPSNLTIVPGQDGPKKKQKLLADTPVIGAPPQTVAQVEPPKKKFVEKVAEPALVPEQPRMRILPCAICWGFVAGEDARDEGLCCNRCRLTVHRSCYGVADGRPKDKWTCDMCTNDAAHQVSTNYDCVLCSVREYTDTELMEAPKTHRKKKDDRQKEKERLERELLVNATEMYYRSQREKGRPEQPRQPLKRTTNNNWVHVVCAIFHPELRFSDPKTLEPAEGFGAIPHARFRLKCKLCKKSEGACVNCSQCQANVHVACAQQFGYQLGFDIAPVKGSRANTVNIVDMNGDKGTAAAVIYCKEHTKAAFVAEKKTGIHDMAEILTDPDNPDTKLNALQAYVRSHKQADTSLTGTLRKALLLDSATSTATQIANAGANHRSSISSASGATGNLTSVPTVRSSRVSPGAVTVKSDEVDQDGDRVIHLDLAIPAEPGSKECVKCGTTVSPKWRAAESKVISEFKQVLTPENIIEESGAAQPANAHPNGHIDGHVDSVKSTQQDSAAPLLPSSQPEVATTISTELDGTVRADEEDLTKTKRQSSAALLNGETTLLESEISNVVDEPPSYLCNKCYQRKRREPTPPPRTPTPQPDPMEVESEAPAINEDEPENEASKQPEPSPPPVAVAWPSQVAHVSTQEPYHGWPAQSVAPASAQVVPSPPAPYHPPERLSNGIPHSPPVVAPPPPQHYPPPPQHQPSYAPHPPQNYRDSRGVLHRGMPPQYHVPHIVNGVPVEPPSFQYRRDSTGQLYQVPYVPPAMRQQSSALRSPRLHDRSSQGPHGPPEAAENPFAVPNTSHSPPRQTFNGMYGSPSGNRERPETPPDGFVRDGRWAGDGGMANGASASPSLRNLLH